MNKKVMYCQVNKECTLHIANGTFNSRKLPNKVKNMQKKLAALVIAVTQ
jgi:hypothetical protein